MKFNGLFLLLSSALLFYSEAAPSFSFPSKPVAQVLDEGVKPVSSGSGGYAQYQALDCKLAQTALTARATPALTRALQSMRDSLNHILALMQRTLNLPSVRMASTNKYSDVIPALFIPRSCR